MAGWYVRRGEKVIGPIDLAKLRELAAVGKLLPTDRLAEDVAGPWTEAKSTFLFEPARITQPAPSQLPAVQPPPIEPPPVLEQPAGTLAVIIKRSKKFVAVISRGTVAAGQAVSHSLATRAQRRHELELAKIQAQGRADSQQPQVPAASAMGPMTFAPQIVQTTVVKVSNGNEGCGCTGCALILLILIVLFIMVMTRGNHSQSNLPKSSAPAPHPAQRALP